MWSVGRMARRGFFTVVLCLAASGIRAQTPRQPSLGRETWYEFLLKKCNPSDFDYGAWLEKRREAILEASVKEPHFWYSLGDGLVAVRDGRVREIVFGAPPQDAHHRGDDG